MLISAVISSVNGSNPPSVGSAAQIDWALAVANNNNNDKVKAREQIVLNSAFFRKVEVLRSFMSAPDRVSHGISSGLATNKLLKQDWVDIVRLK